MDHKLCLVTGCAGPVSDQAGNLGWAADWRSEPCECLDTTEPWLTGTTSPRLVAGLDTTCVDQIECILPFPPSRHRPSPHQAGHSTYEYCSTPSLTWLGGAHKQEFVLMSLCHHFETVFFWDEFEGSVEGWQHLKSFLFSLGPSRPISRNKAGA